MLFAAQGSYLHQNLSVSLMKLMEQVIHANTNNLGIKTYLDFGTIFR